MLKVIGIFVEFLIHIKDDIELLNIYKFEIEIDWAKENKNKIWQ